MPPVRTGSAPGKLKVEDWRNVVTWKAFGIALALGGLGVLSEFVGATDFGPWSPIAAVLPYGINFVTTWLRDNR